MKYKMLGMIVCICTLLLSIFTLVFTGNIKTRYHQHIEATEKIDCIHTEEIFCTHLPLVTINTNGKEIPGRTIFNEIGKVIGHTLSTNGEDEISAYITIIDHETTYNHITDEATIQSDIRIHVRGNSSRAFDKAGYSIRLVTENGENNSQSVMGMDSHHEWALHGPYLDKTLLQNYMWYNIAGEIMDYAPNVRFCEVMLNNEYQGIYVMTESITAGEDGARLNLTVNKKDNTFSGYLIRLDRGSNTEMKNMDTFSQYTYRARTLINIEYPGTGNLTEELRESIRQDFSQFEKMLYSYDYNDSEYGFLNYIDLQSFVAYFLMNELTCNYDAGWLSTYMYKDIDGKYRMCVWDFNSACGGYEHPIDTHHFEMQNCLWYVMLMKDEEFTENIISQYRQLRETYFSDEYLNSYVEGVVDYLGPAIQRNYEKWGYSFEEEYDMFEPVSRNPRSHAEAIRNMKNFLAERVSWLDENIETLRQYSANSKVKKFNEHTE